MDFSTPPLKSIPNLHKSSNKNVFHIGGIPIQFPYNPYGSQLAYMGRVISTLDRALKDGHCHALLESPTGTGKSLSLLCSALAWQQNYKSKNMYEMLVHQSSAKPNPEAVSDPLGHGGGFVPETQPPASGNIESTASSVPNGKTPKKKIAPTIFYASRTHTQISQVIREYQKTAYRVPMAVLASRKHYCTNTKICGQENIDEQCKLLLKAEDVGCLEFKNMVKVKSHPSLKKGGCHEAHDIEDLVKVGQDVKGCSYYAARSMAEDAQLVFCPYSYIINPVIRGAMEVDIKGAIVILDEAHNIEDIARDAGSVDLEEDVLDKLQTELQQLCQADALIYQPLYEMTQDIMSWIEQKKDTLEKREFQHYFSCWTGDKALIELQEANISLQCFPILKECAYKAIRAATDKDLKAPHLSGMSVLTLEGLFSSLSYFFSGNGIHVFDYQLAVQRYVKKDAGGTTGGWTHTFSLWCLNPAVVFKEISDLSLSVILTSGTLSPMNSFSSELGVEFGTTLEAPHVIDVESQLWAAVIATGPGNYPMNASYKTADGYAFQDALGNSLEEICKIVPGGALVFFPSYKLMEKLCNRWHETGQYSRLNAQKTLFVEPRGGSPEDFEPVLKGYYNSVRGVNRPTLGRKRKGKKMDPSTVNITASQDSHVKKGATFLAVCRGKLSEGIDFSDENARVVIVVGIPFPNIFDIQVAQKKKYNDTYKSSKNLLSGNEWYCNQAFRALNQAAGRCIRHRFDYGAIIFLDERFQSERNKAYVSKWLRKSIKQYDNFDMSLEGLKSFFINAKEQFDHKISRVLQNSDIDVEINAQKDQIKDFFEKKKQKPNKSDVCSKKSVSKTKMLTEKSPRLSKSVSYVSEYDSNYSKLKSWLNTEAQTVELMGENDTSSCKEDGSSPKGLRYSPAISMVSSYNGAEVSHVNETPSVVSICKDEDSSSTIIESASDFPFYLTNSTETPPQTTPKKIATKNSYSLTTEMESSLNLSVNSHTKKRRSMASPLTYLDFKSEKPASIVPVMDKKLQIWCLECKNPFGLPENHLYVTCALTLSPKVYLETLLKGMDPIGMNASTGIPVVISDISSVNQRLYDRKSNGQGIWSEADGCVFNTIFCPFCPSPNNCLGVEIVATDASNVQFLNKMLLYFYRLEIKNFEQSENKDLPLVSQCQSYCGEVAVSDSFDKYSYKSQQSPGGWRTTRSKLSLPKRVQISNSEDQCGTQTKPYQIK